MCGDCKFFSGGKCTKHHVTVWPIEDKCKQFEGADAERP